MSHVDPNLRRELFGWYSHRLGMDMPIALDYRNTPTPTVIFLGRRVLNRWITVAPSVTDPISKLSRP